MSEILVPSLLATMAGNPTALTSGDSRVVARFDPSITNNSTNYPGSYAVQCSAAPGASGSVFTDLTTPLMHADGTTLWAGYEASAAHGGKTALTLRIKEGQGGFWAPGTLRAEVFRSGGPLSTAISELGQEYWLVFDFAVDDDIITNTGLQSSGARNTLAIHGFHSQNWEPTWTESAGQDSGRMWLTGNTLIWGHAAPGTGNWKRYDVRSIPFNSSFTSGTGGGLDYGDPVDWMLADIGAGERICVIAKVRLSSVVGDNPRTEIWLRQGTGLLRKLVDYSGPNTFSAGDRYGKGGIYSWENNSTWWGNKNTRTIRYRSMAYFHNDAGTPPLTVTSLDRWLNRA